MKESSPFVIEADKESIQETSSSTDNKCEEACRKKTDTDMKQSRITGGQQQKKVQKKVVPSNLKEVNIVESNTDNNATGNRGKDEKPTRRIESDGEEIIRRRNDVKIQNTGTDFACKSGQTPIVSLRNPQFNRYAGLESKAKPLKSGNPESIVESLKSDLILLISAESTTPAAASSNSEATSGNFSIILCHVVIQGHWL